MALYHDVELKEPLKYIFNHAVIPMYFTSNHTGFINLLEFFPLLKSGKALYNTVVQLFYIYAKYNHLIEDDEVILDDLLGKNFQCKITPEAFGVFTSVNTIPMQYSSEIHTQLWQEHTIIKNINENKYRVLYIQQLLNFSYMLKSNNIFLTNPYIDLIDAIRKTNGYEIETLLETVDVRRYQYEIYHYSTYTTANTNIANKIKKEIIKLSWFEREVIKTCIEQLIGPSTIPDEIHCHLLNYVNS